MSKPRMIELNDLCAGDILLCYENAKIDPVGKGITKATDSDYTHAAICIDDTTAAESLVKQGVIKTPIKALLSRYDHLAVFRQPDAWKPLERITALNIFIDNLIRKNATYNLSGIANYLRKHEIHQLTLTEQLNSFFEGTFEPAPVLKSKYFCSELVVNCFVVTGFFDPSMAVAYNSKYTSPGALGRDVSFGTFYGYMSAKPSYSIPSTDEFFNTSDYDSIFNS